MKANRSLIALFALAVMAGVFLVCPQPGILVSNAYASELPKAHQIISDTLEAYKILCLSKDGLIERVFLDGKWVVVQEVELVARTIILRTDRGNLSLAAVCNTP